MGFILRARADALLVRGELINVFYDKFLRFSSQVQVTAGFALAFAVLVGAAPALPLNRFLRITVTIGTLAEILMWAGFFWIPKWHRRLPLWSISRRVARFFFTRPACNALLSIAAVVLLIASLFFGDIWKPLVYASLMFLAAAFAVDFWRACYLHYWFMGLASLLLPGAVTSLVIIMQAGGSHNSQRRRRRQPARRWRFQFCQFGAPSRLCFPTKQQPH